MSATDGEGGPRTAGAPGSAGSRGAAGSPGSGTGPQTAREMLDLAKAFLERKELPEWRLEAELLVAQALNVSRMGLFLIFERPVSGAEVDLARDFLVRRGRREPTAYIIGKREFYCRDFAVGPGVLIPRPETELLVDRARELAAALGVEGDRGAHAEPAGAERGQGENAKEPYRIAELGTGSGCLAVTLALEIPGAEIIATDISARALEQARANGEALGAVVHWQVGDGLAPLAECAARNGPFDLLLSNPPYIGGDEAGELAPEVIDYEPREALFAPGYERDYWLRRLVAEGVELLKPGGYLLVELGAAQGAAARELCAARGLSCEVRRDLAGLDRVLEVRRPV
ncbi:MAG: peptide chain release factor N(5)-glutamine methyltransferase [Planctomycetota bacterium]|nr:peptide chain release factor N(5)-glutamine methyltransferase [Planctomycetota bacterium]